MYVERESGRQEVLEMIESGEAVGLSSIDQLLSEKEMLSIAYHYQGCQVTNQDHVSLTVSI
ncbi:hypothetical protein FZC78_08520 [Rossellomorea vietnamensis]|uniref:Uncharacterized protein n=1 Tax=Rossellomorea vietnamensis TaxID=218284 RepID=A0A5D4NUI1_9BACI|nr:hypothetical protein [Rossellomorea vietnamensis]TYS17877.1 hypothetical protein FZC78_08520 [Rossellomorea vietnamensis]